MLYAWLSHQDNCDFFMNFITLTVDKKASIFEASSSHCKKEFFGENCSNIKIPNFTGVIYIRSVAYLDLEEETNFRIF